MKKGTGMRKVISVFLTLGVAALLPQGLCGCFTAWAMEDAKPEYRFADAGEAAVLLLSNEDYYDNLTQDDLNYRMQHKDATLEELKEFASTQTLDFTEEEKQAIDEAMGQIWETCSGRGYHLPPEEGIVFAKTTMNEECGAGAYTHGTQIYLGSRFLEIAMEKSQKDHYLEEVVAHELFHCLTRNAPEFRSAMYKVIGFTVVDEEYQFPDEIRNVIISNPDVEHHNSCASFDINGKATDCAVVFLPGKPFEQPGDSFFDGMKTGLVPVDTLSTLYTAEDAANFWDVFGRNTEYVIDPEETMADNFSYTIVRGTDASLYETPRIIQEIDSLLKAGAYE